MDLDRSANNAARHRSETERARQVDQAGEPSRRSCSPSFPRPKRDPPDRDRRARLRPGLQEGARLLGNPAAGPGPAAPAGRRPPPLLLPPSLPVSPAAGTYLPLGFTFCSMPAADVSQPPPPLFREGPAAAAADGASVASGEPPTLLGARLTGASRGGAAAWRGAPERRVFFLLPLLGRPSGAKAQKMAASAAARRCRRVPAREASGDAACRGARNTGRRQVPGAAASGSAGSRAGSRERRRGWQWIVGGLR